MAVTDSDGYFRAADAILDRVANHRRQYAVLALAPEGVGYALAGDKGQDPSNMELRLTAPVKFPVRVLDESGQPLGGAGMQARPNVLKWNCYDHGASPTFRKRLWIGDMPAEFKERFTTTSDSEGWAEFTRLPAIYGCPWNLGKG